MHRARPPPAPTGTCSHHRRRRRRPRGSLRRTPVRPLLVRLDRAQLPEPVPHLGLGAVADGARVDQDGVGVFGRVRHHVVVRTQHGRDDLGVAHVHLAPVRLHVRRASSARGRRRRRRVIRPHRRGTGRAAPTAARIGPQEIREARPVPSAHSSGGGRLGEERRVEARARRVPGKRGGRCPDSRPETLRDARQAPHGERGHLCGRRSVD